MEEEEECSSIEKRIESSSIWFWFLACNEITKTRKIETKFWLIVDQLKKLTLELSVTICRENYGFMIDSELALSHAYNCMGLIISP